MRFSVGFASISFLLLTGCSGSSAPETKDAKKTIPVAVASASNKHPLAKFVEIAGFRLSEAGGGKLRIRFVTINHSLADIGNLGLRVKLSTNSAKPDDPPIATFDAKVPDLGPEEIQDVTSVVSSKLRVYELPDWQFLKAEFEITSPQP